MKNTFTKSGINAIGDAEWGTHLCHFYESDDELLGTLVPFFKAGLENNELCLWIISKPLMVAVARDSLRNKMPEFDRYIETGQMEIISHNDWFLRDGVLNLQAAVEKWETRINEGRTGGYGGLRASCDTSWLEAKEWARFIQYEELLDAAIEGSRALIVCTYAVGKCGAREVLEVFQSHESALFKSRGRSKFMEYREQRGTTFFKENTMARLIAENARELICIIDLEGHYVYASPSFRSVLGYGGKESLPTRFMDIMHQDDFLRLSFWPNVSLYEFRAKNAAGEWLWLEGSNNIVFYNNEMVVTIVARDITERKKAEKAIEKLSRQNELILNSAAEGIFGLDMQGNHTFVNSAAAQMLGYRVKEMTGRASHEMCHHTRMDGTSYPEEKCPIYSAYKDGIIRRVKDEIFWRKDGTSFPVAYTSTPILENGRITGAVVTFRDITERKRIEEKLSESEKKFRLLAKNLPAIVYRLYLNGENKIQFMNSMLTSMTGYSENDVEKGALSALEPLILYEDRQRVQEDLRIAVTGKRPFQLEYRIRHKSGDIRSFVERGRPVYTGGMPAYIDGVVFDITELRMSENGMRGIFTEKPK